MNKKLSAGLFASLMVAVVIAGSPVQQAQAMGRYYFNFQQTTKPFIAHATQNMATSLVRVAGDATCEPTLQNYYARLLSQPVTESLPGTARATWIVASFPGAQGEADSVTVSWSARADPGGNGKGNCVNCLATAYVGAAAPQRAEDFTVLPNQGYFMTTKWANYQFNTLIVPAAANTIYVAIGWNGVDAAIDLDCVTVSIVPIVK